MTSVASRPFTIPARTRTEELEGNMHHRQQPDSPGLVQRFVRHLLLVRRSGEQGASSVEYGLLIVGVAGAIVGAVLLFGGHVSFLYSNSCQQISTATQTGNC